MQSRSYDDYAALYYLLLSKWEKGNLQIPSTTPPVPYPRLSQSGVVPVINVNTSDLVPLTSVPKNPWHHLPAAGVSQMAGGWDDYPSDPTLARYLKLGRRHTLGAAQNHMLVPPSDLGHLREASECSSQASNNGGAGSITNPSPLDPEAQQSAHGSSHTDGLYQPSSTNTPSAPTRPLLQPPQRSRSGRRASDGGPYAAAFRLYLEKRTPQLAQINSQSSLQDSTSLSSTSSVKQLLLEKRVQETHFGKLPFQPKEWTQYKDQARKCFVYVTSSTCVYMDIFLSR